MGRFPRPRTECYVSYRKTFALPGGINAASELDDAPSAHASAWREGTNDRKSGLFSANRHRVSCGSGSGCRDRGTKASTRAEVSWREGEWAQLQSKADRAQRRCDAHL